MNIKGFLLIEVLMGLFLLGLIAVTCLPILSTASHNLKLTKDRIDMLFTAESIIEQIKSFDYNWIREDEYLYDMQLIELIERLEEDDFVTIRLPLDIETTNSRYLCIISKENYSEDLWKIEVEVTSFEEEKRITNVKIMACMETPTKNDILAK